jgi:hypothetical protein
MVRTSSLVAAVLLGAIGVGGYFVVFGEKSTAQDKKGPNVQEPVKAVKESDKTSALQDLELAARLIQYGRSQKHAESLLIAAQIIHKTPTEKLDAGFEVQGGKDNASAPPAKEDDSPKALVAEAQKLSDSPHVESLAAATSNILEESPRGAAGGPKTDNFVIQAFETVTWRPIAFVGLQPAVIHINNRVFGAMVLEVIDEFGNVVARDNIPGTYFRVQWTPAFTGPFTIRLRNIDSIAFHCTVLTN